MARAALNMEPNCMDLPDEILEQHVLPLLPLASLCRFRAVCKKWNNYITHPDFAALHAIASPAEDFALITIRTSVPFTALGGWEILDLTKDRVFPLGQDFLAAQARPSSMDGDQRVVLAADGGLLLLWYSKVVRGHDHMLLVCNLLLKVAKVIPSLSMAWVFTHHYKHVVMSTDRASMAYEIVVFHPMVNHYQLERIDIFQSKTGMWRRVVNPVVPSREWWLADARFVKLKSRLYRLYRRQSVFKPHLVEFDKTTGLSSVVFLQKSFCNAWIDKKFLELVVSQDRLFCLSKWGSHGHGYSFVEIFEIFPEQHNCELVASMPLRNLNWLHGDEMDKPAKERDVRAVMCKYLDPIVALGCASSILICSCIGRTVGFDLVDNSWRYYSDSNLLKQHLNSTESGRYLECRNMGVSLCRP